MDGVVPLKVVMEALRAANAPPGESEDLGLDEPASG